MRLRSLCLVPAITLGTLAAVITSAAPAGADCNYSGGSTLCSSTGSVRGGSAPPPPTFDPYPCTGDPTCMYYDTWDPNIYLDLSPRPDPPNRPGWPGGGPGRPGRPGGGGGGIGPR